MSRNDNVRFRLAAYGAFVIAFAVDRTSRRRCYRPFSPSMRLFPNSIQRYVFFYRIGQKIPHIFACPVKRKAYQAGTLFCRSGKLFQCLSLLDFQFRYVASALSVKSDRKNSRFALPAVFTCALLIVQIVAGDENAGKKQ